MPELPEVQTVLDTLANQIKDRKIVDIKILYKPIVETDEKTFKNSLINQHFRVFKRRGKYLIFEMDDISLVSHLRMEGKYFILDESTPLSKHDHVIFYLDDGKQLRYNDVRKFGRMELRNKEKEYRDFHGLGPEPFSDEFCAEYCLNYFKNNKLPIKQVLLDQSFVAGIGNIYADEINYAIKINPKTKASNLTKKDCANIVLHTRKILAKAIEAGGTTIRSYTSSLGVTGRFQLNLNVHTKSECPKCKGKIKKIVVGGRGTYYCPNCQTNRISIAITGTIGSGKSEVSAYLRKLGYEVFDCDKANSELLKKNLQVKEAFKQCYIGNKLDKSKLAKLIFKDEKAKKKLEAIMHPLILEQLKKQAEKYEVFFAEVPLLFESKWEKYFDTNILLVSEEKVALKRLKLRGLNTTEAKKRIANQMSVEQKMQCAKQIIYNNDDLSSLYNKIDEYLDNYVR